MTQAGSISFSLRGIWNQALGSQLIDRKHFSGDVFPTTSKEKRAKQMYRQERKRPMQPQRSTGKTPLCFLAPLQVPHPERLLHDSCPCISVKDPRIHPTNPLKCVSCLERLSLPCSVTASTGRPPVPIFSSPVAERSLTFQMATRPLMVETMFPSLPCR